MSGLSWQSIVNDGSDLKVFATKQVPYWRNSNGEEDFDARTGCNKHSRILLHQPYAGAQGQATDIELAAKEILRLRELLEEILAHHTGQPIERLHDDTDRDFVMTAAEAREYGIIDEVIDVRSLTDNSGPIAAVSA